MAQRLERLRDEWLWPTGLWRTEPEVVSGFPERRLPVDAAAEGELAMRTLTHLYNEKPRWLQIAQADLDGAVAAAYGWPPQISDDDAMTELLKLNLARPSVA